MGCIVRDDRTVGAGVTVGAGAVVVADIAPGRHGRRPAGEADKVRLA